MKLLFKMLLKVLFSFASEIKKEHDNSINNIKNNDTSKPTEDLELKNISGLTNSLSQAITNKRSKQ